MLGTHRFLHGGDESRAARPAAFLDRLTGENRIACATPLAEYTNGRLPKQASLPRLVAFCFRRRTVKQCYKPGGTLLHDKIANASKTTTAAEVLVRKLRGHDLYIKGTVIWDNAIALLGLSRRNNHTKNEKADAANNTKLNQAPLHRTIYYIFSTVFDISNSPA